MKKNKDDIVTVEEYNELHTHCTILQNKYNKLLAEISHVLTSSLSTVEGLIIISKIEQKEHEIVILKLINDYKTLAKDIINRNYIDTEEEHEEIVVIKKPRNSTG